MKKLLAAWATGSFFVIAILSAHRLTAQTNTPRPLRADVQVRRFMSVENNCIRIEKDPASGDLYYLRISGEIYRLDRNGQSRQLVSAAADHGITSAAGLAISNIGTFFLVGNLTQNNTDNIGIIKKGEMANNTRVWSTVAQTVPYPLNIQFNHNFNAIVISPDEQFLYVNSGARTDHGEDQRGDGTREFPLTSIILRLPIDGQNILLENDTAFLKTNGYLFASGVRNHFDLAFAPNGDLFGTENSGDRDDAEELNWIREGFHYGFPWRIGTNNTPQQFPGYNPDADPLVSRSSFAYGLGFFHDDSTYPRPPEGVEFTDPVSNSGPDADRYREPNGTVKDASNEGISISTFTPHRVPLGLVFDRENALSDEFAGDAFALCFGTGSSALGDPGNDLLHLELRKIETGQRYEVKVTRLVEGFSGGRFDRGPVDAVMLGNKIYAIETGSPNIWEITLPAKLTSVKSDFDQPGRFHLAQNYPNPFCPAFSGGNPSTTIRFDLDRPSKVSLKIYNLSGQTVQTVLDDVHNSQGSHAVTVDMSDHGSGIYFYVLVFESRRLVKKLMWVK
jgi:glucose/arabinose dehydrogenase